MTEREQVELAGLGVVVTGAGSGIGRGIARAFASEGAHVVVADICRQDAEAVALQLERDYDTRALPFVCDVAELEAVEALAAFSLRELDTINVLCNNAGVGRTGRIDQTRPSDFEWIFAVNVTGVYNGVRAFAPHLKATAEAGGFAHVLNTASEHALGLPATGPMSVYTASKHAVLGMTEAMRRDFAPANVGVSLLCPGPVDTGVWDCARNRQPRYGGARSAPAEFATVLQDAQKPDETGRIALDGVLRGDFYILSHPEVRGFVRKRCDELMRALDDADERTSSPAQSLDASAPAG